MTTLPLSTNSSFGIGGLMQGRKTSSGQAKDMSDLIISYAGKHGAPAGGRDQAASKGSNRPLSANAHAVGASRDAGVKNPEIAAIKQETADIDRQIAGIDDALSQTRHTPVEFHLKQKRKTLEVKREQLNDMLARKSDPANAAATAMADIDYAVGSDVQRRDVKALADKATAKLDKKIADLKQRRTELKQAMDGANRHEKPALANENRQVQTELKALQAQRSEVRAMADLPDAPDALAMATDVYNKNSKLDNTHLTRISDSELKELGFKPELLENRDSDFHAAIYRNYNTGEVVLAFEGTSTGKDWKANGDQGRGISTSQYEQAKEIGLRFNETFPDEKKVITGHSLGGGLAAYAGLWTGNKDIKVITFNAAGLHDSTLASANDQGGVTRADADKVVTNFNLDGEMLTTMQEGKPVSVVANVVFPILGIATAGLGMAMPDAVGRNYDIKAYDAMGDPVGMVGRAFGNKSVELHKTDAFGNSMQAEINHAMTTMRDIIEDK